MHSFIHIRNTEVLSNSFKLLLTNRVQTYLQSIAYSRESHRLCFKCCSPHSILASCLRWPQHAHPYLSLIHPSIMFFCMLQHSSRTRLRTLVAFRFLSRAKSDGSPPCRRAGETGSNLVCLCAGET